MKKAIIIIGIIILLAACSGSLLTPLDNPADGKGTVHITLGDKVKTLLPSSFDISKMNFVLTFIPGGGGEQVVRTLNRSSHISVDLSSGAWTLDVKGYISGADTSTAAANVSGTETFTLLSNSIAVQVDLNPHIETLSQNGNGTLSYSISIPSGATGVLAVHTYPQDTYLQSVSFTSANYSTGEMELASGSYNIHVTVRYNGKEKAWREVARICDDAITEMEPKFAAGDFLNSGVPGITDFSVSIPNEFVHINDDAGTITLCVLPGTDVSALKSIISYNGAMIFPEPGVTTDFNNPVTYTVYAENGSKKVYTVTVSYAFTDLDQLEEYLSLFSVNTENDPISVSVQIDLDSKWTDLLGVLNNADRFVDLNVAPSMGMATFDPGAGYTGKNKVVSLALPHVTTDIRDGTLSDPAFRYFSNLRKITGTNVRNIGSYAFNNCTKLISFNFPELVFCGEYSFRGCTGLTGVTMPDSVTTVAVSAFSLCTGLTAINVSGGNSILSSIDGLLCRNSPVVTLILCPEGKAGTLNIPQGIASIGDSAFSGCIKINGVIIPGSITSVAASVFSGYTGFTAAINTNSTINWAEVFDNTTDLTVVFGSGVNSIGNYAFPGCTGLTSVTMPGSIASIGNFAFSECTGLSTVTIPNSVTTIGNSAFSGCTGLGSVTIPSGVTSIGNSAFSGLADFTATIHTGSAISWTQVFGTTTNISVIFGSGVTSIGNSAFSGCTELISINIPASVTSIGSSAFSDCIKIFYVDLPNNITRIESAVFQNCTGLGGITIPDGVTYIGSRAFSGCTGFTSVSLPDSLASIGDNAYENCSKLRTTTIPVNVTEIGNAVYSGCTDLSVTINTNSIKSWTPVFTNTAKLTVILGSSVTSIWGSSFSGSAGLISVTIPGSIVSIDPSAFSGCKGLASVTIQEGVIRMGSYSFYNCTALKSIVLPESVARIENNAFDGCTGLFSVFFNSVITRENFSEITPFLGDLRVKYYMMGTGDPGLYTTSGDLFLWTKQ